MLAERIDPLVDRALRFAVEALEASGGAFYRVAADLTPYDFTHFGVPMDFHAHYLGGMHRFDPMTARRMCGRRLTIARFGAAASLVSHADYARYREFCGHFEVADCVELLFGDGERILAGMNVAWNTREAIPANAERLAHQLRDFLEISFARGGVTGRSEEPSIRRYGLTPRERDVAMHLRLGRANQEIARRLGIGPATVKTHLIRVLEKLGVENRAAAAALLAGLPEGEVNRTVDYGRARARHTGLAANRAAAVAARRRLETLAS